MKLLFDQNISFRIVNNLKNLFPGSSQVRHLGLEDSSDIEIWNYAKTHNYAIVTFDADFFDFSIVKGVPPKIIWLRIGNTTTNNLIEILKEKSSSIQEFLSSKELEDVGCLEIIQ